MPSFLLVAANLIVSTAADSGTGSLREAIDVAIASPEDDVIDFDPGLAGQTIELRTSAAAPVDRDYGPTAFYVDAAGGSLTIRWDRAHGRAPRLDAGGERRHFVVDTGGSLRLEGIWLSHGYHEGGRGGHSISRAGGGGAGMGGSIFVREGALVLVDALLTDSRVRGGDGGRGSSVPQVWPGGGGGGLGGDGATPTGGPPLGGASPGFGGGGSGGVSPPQLGADGGFGGGGGGGSSENPTGTCCGPGCEPFPGFLALGGRGGFGGGAGAFGPSPGFAGGASQAALHGGGGAALGGAVLVVDGTVTATQVTWSGHRGVPGRGGSSESRGTALTAVDSTVTLVANTFQHNGSAAEGAVLVVARDGATASLAIDHTLVVSSSVPAVQTAVIGTGVVTVEGAGNFIEGGAPVVTGSIDPGEIELTSPADHGGGVPTIAVTTDAFVGDCPALTADARGVARPTTGCDAGAYQRAIACTTDGDCATGTCNDGFCCACDDDASSWCAATLGATDDGVCTTLPPGAVCEPGACGPDANSGTPGDDDGDPAGGCCRTSAGGPDTALLVLLVATAASLRRRRRA